MVLFFIPADENSTVRTESKVFTRDAIDITILATTTILLKVIQLSMIHAASFRSCEQNYNASISLINNLEWNCSVYARIVFGP